jgi:urease accessory protein UreF
MMTPFEQFCMDAPEQFTGRPNITVEIPESRMREYRAAWNADRAEAAKWREAAEDMGEALRMVSRKCKMSAEVIRGAERTKATGTMAVALGKIADGHERIARFATFSIAAFNEAKEG